MTIQYKIIYPQGYRNYFLHGVFLLLCLSILLSGNVFAQVPVGMITSLEGRVTFTNKPEQEIDFGTDVFYRDKIKISKDSSVMITYYKGCRQEWYGEKTLIEAGKEHSNILAGKNLKHQTYECETPEIIMSGQNSFKKAAFHFRGETPKNSEALQQKIDLLDRISQNQLSTEDVKFKLWTVKQNNQYFREGESIVIYMLANKDVYLMLDYFQADDQVVHLIPNLFKDKKTITAHTIHAIGGSKSELNLTVNRPFGKESIRALVSTSPFPVSFNSPDSVESSDKYQQRLDDLLKKTDKSLEVHNFVLTFRTTP